MYVYAQYHTTIGRGLVTRGQTLLIPMTISNPSNKHTVHIYSAILKSSALQS